jgi:hypothetical protein
VQLITLPTEIASIKQHNAIIAFNDYLFYNNYMKNKNALPGGLDPRQWRGKPSVIVSPAARRFLDLDSIRFALSDHRDLDNLPYSFSVAEGRKVMLTTTVDNRYTFIFIADEWNFYDKKYHLRKLDAMTVGQH